MCFSRERNIFYQKQVRKSSFFTSFYHLLLYLFTENNGFLFSAMNAEKTLKKQTLRAFSVGTKRY